LLCVYNCCNYMCSYLKMLMGRCCGMAVQSAIWVAKMYPSSLKPTALPCQHYTLIKILQDKVSHCHNLAIQVALGTAALLGMPLVSSSRVLFCSQRLSWFLGPLWNWLERECWKILANSNSFLCQSNESTCSPSAIEVHS
jgi:hypothetical protein